MSESARARPVVLRAGECLLVSIFMQSFPSLFYNDMNFVTQKFIMKKRSHLFIEITNRKIPALNDS